MISVSEAIEMDRERILGFHGSHCSKHCACKKSKPKVSTDEAKLMIAYFRRLEKKATKGPWFQWTKAGDISSQPEDAIIMESAKTRKNKDGCDRATRQGDADCKFVIALRNNLGALLAALEERL